MKKTAMTNWPYTDIRRPMCNGKKQIQELDSIEAIIATKREEIMKKSGKDEIVSSVQYKAYMKKLRSKGTHYKRKKNELEHAKMELQILERTVELLSRRITQLQKQCEKEGRNFIQNSDNQRRGVTAERPKTAKPSTTNVTELKEIIKQLNEQLNEKRARVQRISSSIDEFYQAHKDENEEYYAKQREIDAFKNRLENDYKQLKAEISDLEATIKTKQNDLDTNKENVAKLEWFLEKLSSANEVDAVFQELEQQSVEYMKDINELTAEIEKLEQDENATNQLAMWKSLTKIFRLKINLHQQRNDNDKPIGDNIIY